MFFCENKFCYSLYLKIQSHKIITAAKDMNDARDAELLHLYTYKHFVRKHSIDIYI